MQIVILLYICQTFIKHPKIPRQFMEEQRLKPMRIGYDEKMFNRLFARTENLRKKLSSEIDHRRFGLCFEDMVSFFNTKFIYVFNKYYDQFNEEILLGHIISSLQFFKCRILRSAYTSKYSQHKVEFDSVSYLEETMVENPWDEQDNKNFEKLMNFLRTHLSENAFTMLEIQLNPPPFILQRINPGSHGNLQKIPDHVYLEYFSLGSGSNAYKYLKGLKQEIKEVINIAKYNKDIIIS